MSRGRLAIWRLVLERGLADSERAARALVMSGQILVADRPVDKPGTAVPADAPLRVRGARPYASRGGEKLEHALRRFGISAAGRVALDAGASTGGFTDCLLRHGAVRVYAVDVGFGQLLGRLRQDARVVNLERTNIGALTAEILCPPPNLVTLDLSYLPLSTAWRTIRPLLAEQADVVSLVKPLFEIEDAVARRTGQIVGDEAYLAVLHRLMADCTALGWSPLSVTASPIRGSSGTVEFLAHVRNAPDAGTPPDLERAVAEALSPAGEGSDRP